MKLPEAQMELNAAIGHLQTALLDLQTAPRIYPNDNLDRRALAIALIAAEAMLLIASNKVRELRIQASAGVDEPLPATPASA